MTLLVTPLKTSYHACVSCGGKDYEYLKSYPGFDSVDLVRCAVCKLMQAQPVPSEAFLSEFYAREFGMKAGGGVMTRKDEKGFRLRALMQRHFIEQATGITRWSGKRVLDIGCHAASLLSTFKERGAAVTGVDPNPRSEYAKEWYGISVIRQMFRPGMFASDSFDLILHSHVLEHLIDPAAQLREFYRLLAPNGFVFIEVPNETESKIRQAQVKPHLYFFTPETLSKLAVSAGFEVVLFKTLGIDRRPKSLFSKQGRQWLSARFQARYNACGKEDWTTLLPFHGKLTRQDRYFKSSADSAANLRMVLRKNLSL